MKGMTLRRITKVCGGRYHGPQELLDREVDHIVTDSRQAGRDGLFVPIVGERVDGHRFISQVMEQGALAALSERDLGETPYPYIQITSSLQAVKDLAEEYLKQVKIPVVGITGSVGKTSTKEMIAAVLEQKYRVLKTAGNFNNELGVPLTVFRIRPEHEIAVLEMGISDFGEMTRLARIARPDVAVFTNIGWCHLENLKTRDGIFQAKTEMLQYLKPEGTVIVNGDDDRLCRLQKVNGKEVVKFGKDPAFSVWADGIASRGLCGTVCRVHTPSGDFTAEIPLPGEHMAANALAGTAVGLTFGMKPEEIAAGIASLKPVSGRFNILEKHKMTVVDDCYNANPVSMKASLDVLKEGLGRHVAILGDMGELGADEVALHESVGVHAARGQVDLLITVGPLSRHLAAAAAKEAPQLSVISFDTVPEALEKLPELVREGDTVLVKASHFMKFERIVEAL